MRRVVVRATGCAGAVDVLVARAEAGKKWA
jgi:hypothetical protein